MILEYELYYVAWCKHSRPQHLVAGPFIDRDKAFDVATRLGEHHPHAILKEDVILHWDGNWHVNGEVQEVDVSKLNV